MKREIKFRAWNEGKMVDLLAITPLALDANMNTQLALKGMSGLFLPFGGGIELMQFTGLKDKNGREIYADDVISDGELRYRVYAMYGGFGIKSPYWSKDMDELSIGDDLIIQPLADAQTMSYIAQSYEVIGNIYENPELLN